MKNSSDHISISKSSKIIHQFVERDNSEKSVDELVSDLKEFIGRNNEENYSKKDS